jgi:serine/threonine protein kinase
VPALSAGDRINNYLLDERIGVGSFGEVWKAHHHVFGDLVAIKIPTDPQFVRHLQREGTTIHGLRDPHIVRALDMDPYCDPPYLIMEYVDGPSLRKVLQRHPGGLPAHTAATILCGALQALDAAHRASIIHRDIKPENILIASGEDLSDLTPGQVKIGDFGLVRRGDTAQSIQQSGSLVGDAARRLAGTIAYMSPEQREGQMDLDARSDLYSLGLVLFEMLTGVLPHGRELPGTIRPETPRWLDRIFEQCYTRRDQRFTSAAQMLAAVQRYGPAAGRPDPCEQAGIDAIRGRTTCPHCRGKVQSQDQFCIHCGFQLVSRVPRCPSCHAYTGRADNFCILCGTDLRRTA